MDQLVGLTMEEMKTELGEDTVNTVSEPSALVRCIRMKSKCFIIGLLTLLIFATLCLTTTKEVLRDEQSGRLVTSILELLSQLYLQNATVHEILENIQH